MPKIRPSDEFDTKAVQRRFQLAIYGCEADSAEEQQRRDRECAAEMELRSMLQRQFGSYEIDGAGGTIRAHHAVAINYRALARAAVAQADFTEGRPLRGSAPKSEAA